MHSLHRPHPRALRRKPPERSPRSSPSTHRIARAHHPRPRDRQRPPHAHTRNPRAHDASQKRYNTYITEFIAFDFSRDALVVKQPQLVVIVDLDLLLSTRRRVRNVELRCDAHTHTKARSVRRSYTHPSIHAHRRPSPSHRRRPSTDPIRRRVFRPRIPRTRRATWLSARHRRAPRETNACQPATRI